MELGKENGKLLLFWWRPSSEWEPDGPFSGGLPAIVNFATEPAVCSIEESNGRTFSIHVMRKGLEGHENTDCR